MHLAHAQHDELDEQRDDGGSQPEQRGKRAKRGADKHINMLEGPILPKIVSFAIPLAISGMLEMLFNAMDSATVGQFVGSTALAAVGSDAQVISFLVNLMLGVSVGSTVVVASLMGSGKTRGIQEAIHTSYLFAIIGGVVLGIAGIVFARPILLLLATPGNVIEQAQLYLAIFCIGMPFLMVYNFTSAVLRAVGDTKRPLYALAVAALLNLALNLLFTCVFGWGVAGVAAATSASYGLSAVLVTIFIMHESPEFRLSFRKLRFDGATLARILRIGVPTGFQGVLFTFSNVCLQSGINSCGSDAIAGASTALIFEQLNYAVITAFVQAGITFTSQNYAAGLRDRCKRIATLSIVGCLVGVLVDIALYVGCQGFFIGLFTTEAGAAHYASIRLMYVLGVSFIVVGYEVTGGLMRGYGYSLTPSIIAVFGTCVLRLVWLLAVFPHHPTFEFLMLVYPVSWVVTSVATTAAYIVVRNRAWKVHAA